MSILHQQKPPRRYDLKPETPDVGVDRRTSRTDTPDLERGTDRRLSKSTDLIKSDSSDRKQSFFTKFRKALKTVYKKCGLNHLVPLLFVAMYTLVGAIMFYSIEFQPDVDRTDTRYKDYVKTRQQVIKRIFELGKMHSENSDSQNYQKINETLTYYEAANDFHVSHQTKWDFWNAVFFAGTLYTTIGYGNIACVTAMGRVMTMCYALVGIPLVLVSLNDLGKWLFKALQKLIEYTSTCTHWCTSRRFRRKQPQGNTPSLHSQDSKVEYELLERKPTSSSLAEKHAFDRKGSEKTIINRTNDPELGSGKNIHRTVSAPAGSGTSGREREKLSLLTQVEEESDEEFDSEEIEEQFRTVPKIPVYVALIATVGWIILISGLFCVWEPWTYFESVYFFYISLSTIGLGDIVPDHPKYMVMNFGFVIVGLSLVSMCIQVIQERLEELYLQLLLMILNEYQKQLARTGGNQVDATMGMMQAWNTNPRTKYLMPFLSKGRRKTIVQKFKDDAKAHGVMFPSVLENVDYETGFPSILTIKEGDEDSEDFRPLETLVEESIQKAAAETETESSLQVASTASIASPEVIQYETDTQTDTVEHENQEQQTFQPELLEGGFQTNISWGEIMDEGCQTAFFETAECETQTTAVEQREEESQTAVQLLTESGIQTSNIQTVDKELQSHLYDLMEGEMQTEVIPTSDISVQTLGPEFSEQEVQTDAMEEVIEAVKTKLLKGIPSKAKRKLQNAFPKKSASLEAFQEVGLSPWQNMEEEEEELEDEEEEEEEEKEEEEEEEIVEELHWDPHDGLHAEKQKKVSDLKAMFDGQKAFDTGRRGSLKKADSISGRRRSSLKKKELPSTRRESSARK